MGCWNERITKEFAKLKQKATEAQPYSGKVGSEDLDNVDMAYRVVADHIRTLSFAIADGSCPGNEGREYVLRRILRRAVRYGTEVLKAEQGFFNGLVKVVVEVMGDFFPELKQHEIKIREIIADEEASFGRTLVKGIEKFKKAIYDTGVVEVPSGVFGVSNVQMYGGFVVHIGSFEGKTGRLSVGDKVICKVNYERRKLIAPNHTCTHMLNFALREILGNHVDQKGSIVLPEKLRFDFSHGKPVKPEDLRKIETIVNEQIKSELDVFSKEARLVDAKHVNGLRAVFGEVYPDPVRVVSIGRKVEDLLANPENEEWLSISAELCGGTHISNTREAKAFALLSEEGIAKGIRRVTAVTTDYAFKAMELASSLEQEVNEASETEGSVLEQVISYICQHI
ncbi:alanine--tRNA ligase-like [Olea europaea var. sylvestris]|uniref:alanine--tRNA ligase-like n=1 Tax=Olea europaea var. sylvestris TaxID=158386 RepID=UPI000C1D6853|nr:alanine--tRNA ligase-like [Olea europaea var. sylvestris]